MFVPWVSHAYFYIFSAFPIASPKQRPFRRSSSTATHIPLPSKVITEGLATPQIWTLAIKKYNFSQRAVKVFTDLSFWLSFYIYILSMPVWYNIIINFDIHIHKMSNLAPAVDLLPTLFLTWWPGRSHCVWHTHIHIPPARQGFHF